MGVCRLLRKRSRAYQMCQLRCAGQLFSGLRFPSMFRREYVNAYSCTSFCQERSGEISCEPCAEHTQRYIGVLSGADRRACQCKEGAIFCHQSALARMRLVSARVGFNGPSHRRVPQRETRGRRGSLPSPYHRSVPCAVSYEYTARLRVCRSVRNVRGTLERPRFFSASVDRMP